MKTYKQPFAVSVLIFYTMTAQRTKRQIAAITQMSAVLFGSNAFRLR